MLVSGGIATRIFLNFFVDTECASTDDPVVAVATAFLGTLNFVV
jgi:hypothetical protein